MIHRYITFLLKHTHKKWKPISMLFSILIYFTIFLYGILIGSFLNVCIYRIPRQENITTTRSHCMSCGYNLKWYDLLPVISFLILKGRCRKCGAKISPQYPLIELLNGVLYVVIIVARGGFPKNSFSLTGYDYVSVLFCLATSALIVLSIIDFRTFEIPLNINIVIFIIGLVRLGFDYENWSLYIIGLFSISTFLYLIYLLSKGRAIGGGDIKLMAAGGLLLGWKCIILAFFLGCLIGSVVHVIRMTKKKANRVLALGPYLSAGIFIMLLCGEKLWNWYLNTFIML